MTIRRIVLATWTALAFFAAHAPGQTVPNRFDAVEWVDRACPGLINQDHQFTDAVFTLLHADDPRWGRNGKRGNPNDPSHDAGSYKTSASPFGVAVIDVISCAGGGPNCSPKPAWIDQTNATIAAGTTGVWVKPSGILPSCLSGPSSPAPGDGPGQPPVGTGPSTDMTEVLVALSRIENRLTILEAVIRHDDLGIITRYVDDMVGEGPVGGAGPHVTDIKQRLDVIRVNLEQLNAWLRGRSIFRF